MQAAHESPTLSHLTQLALESNDRLKSIEPLIPQGIFKTMKAGPIDGATWCLILDNNAAAAKVRQLSPAIQAHLRTKGWNIDTLRLKVQTSRGQ